MCIVRSAQASPNYTCDRRAHTTVDRRHATRSCKINLRNIRGRIVDVPKSALRSCEKRWAPLKTPIEPPPRSPEPLRLEGAALARHRAGAPPAPKRGSGPPSSPAAAAGSTSSTLSAASLARPPLSRLSGSATAVHHRPEVAVPLWMRRVQKWVRAFVTPQHGLIKGTVLESANSPFYFRV